MRASKSVVLAAALAAVGAWGLHADPAEARVNVSIYATSEPPPLREEVVPGPRRGYVWVPGAWNWGHNRYNWSKGHWLKERRGYHYTPARWERDGNRWRRVDGRWDH